MDRFLNAYVVWVQSLLTQAEDQTLWPRWWEAMTTPPREAYSDTRSPHLALLTRQTFAQAKAAAAQEDPEP